MGSSQTKVKEDEIQEHFQDYLDPFQATTKCLLIAAFSVSFVISCLVVLFINLMGAGNISSGQLSALKAKSRKENNRGWNAPNEELAEPLRASKERVEKIQEYLKRDTANYEPSLLASAKKLLMGLWRRSVIGLLLVDHHAISLQRNGAANADSSGYSVTRVIVEGLTAEAVERGLSVTGEFPPSEFRVEFANRTFDPYWKKQWEAIKIRSNYTRCTKRPYNGYFSEDDYAHGIVYRYEPEAVQANLKHAVRSLEESGARAISGNDGFLIYFQDYISEISKVPVATSPVMQLSMMKSRLGGNASRKILVLTANSYIYDADSMIPRSVLRPSEVKRHVAVLGLERTEYFRWRHGEQAVSQVQPHSSDGATIRSVLPSVIDALAAKIAALRTHGDDVVAILCESMTLSPISNALRYHFQVPVYDAQTLLAFLAEGNRASLSSTFLA